MSMLESRSDRRHRREPPYRIDFALMTIAGNYTRYRTTRPIVERDPEVISRWYPITTWKPHDWVHVLPGMAKVRARHLLDSRRLLFGRAAEAVVLHAFETYGLFSIRKRVFKTPTVLVCNPDGFEPSRLNPMAFQQTDLFVPWSTDCEQTIYAWFADAASKTRVLHPGIDLSKWTFQPNRDDLSSRRFRLLFIGGDFARKGGATLLEAFERTLHSSCDLTIVTQRPFVPPKLWERLERHPQITVRTDVESGSVQSHQLYDSSDALVLPTRREGLPWVLLESLASGLPAISTPVNGIPDVIIGGTTGLTIDVDDPDDIVNAVDRLRTDPALADRLRTEGRRHVEEHFDAEANTRVLLEWTKDLIDERRARSADRPGSRARRLRL